MLILRIRRRVRLFSVTTGKTGYIHLSGGIVDKTAAPGRDPVMVERQCTGTDKGSDGTLDTNRGRLGTVPAD